MNLQKNLLLALHLLLTSLAYSQSKPWPVKPKNTTPSFGRNDIRVGLYLTRLSISYDRALSDKFSVGIEGLRHWGNFTGFTVSAVGRYYFKDFNSSGFFIEEKLTYGFYNPVVYDSIIAQLDDNEGWGQHNASLNVFESTTSLGRRVYLNNTFFIEFLLGLRLAGFTRGSNDKYMITGQSVDAVTVYSLSPNNPFPNDPYASSNAFYTIGPGFPLYFNIRMGFIF